MCLQVQRVLQATRTQTDRHTHSQLYRIPRAATPRGIIILEKVCGVGVCMHGVNVLSKQAVLIHATQLSHYVRYQICGR